MTADSCKQAYRALRDNRGERLPGECIEPLLLWLCGSRNGAAAEVYGYLGSPFDDTAQVQRVYQALDAVLFSGNELLPLTGEADKRRELYRLLSRTFHPDRYPELAEWLGPRAQTINAAFNQFKTNPEAADRNAAAEPRPPARQEEKPFARRIGLRERLIRLCAPLAHSRYLPQKILAVTALLCAVPLVFLYQQHEATQPYTYDWTAPAAAGQGYVTSDTVAIESVMTPVGVTMSVPVQHAIAVMNRFQSSFEGGELESLLATVSDRPRENGNAGLDWFRQSYGDLFRHTRSRSLALSFSKTEVEDGGVRLIGHYAMQIIFWDGRRADGRGPVRYRLVPGNGAWKISAIDYRRED